MRAPLSAEEFWTLRSEMSDTLRAKLAGLSKTQVEELRREVIAAAASYASGQGISFPAEVLIVGGSKESS